MMTRDLSYDLYNGPDLDDTLDALCYGLYILTDVLYDDPCRVLC